MYKLSKDTKLTPNLITKYIELDRPNLARQEKLLRYFKGEHDIMRR